MARYSRLQKLGSYMRPHWKPTFWGVFSLLIVNAVGVYIPLLIRNAVDTLQIATKFDQVFNYVVLILILASIMWVIRMVSRILLFGVGRQVEFDLKQQIFNHLLTLEPSYFAVNTVGDLINRATSDLDNIRRLVGFAVLSLANTAFAYALRLSAMSDLIQEDMSGISVIKIYAQEENERRAFADCNKKLLDANLELAQTRNFIFPLLGGLASISLLVLLSAGGGAIAKGEISIGDFVALLIYVERLVFPTALLGFTITAYQRGEVSVDRIESILTVEPKIKDAADAVELPTPVIGQIVARHLNYTYPGAKTPALKDVNFTIKPGETVAIVGAIGSGKSTLANALPRLLNIDPGQLFVDEQDITEVKLRELRGAIAYVPQESFLFGTSIKNNIRYGNPLAEQPEIEAAAKQAQIHPEILNFPQEYKTVVGERGITLSGGQRQRTALARALLVDAPVLILDDALSSVDNQTASDILHNLATGTDRKTVIFISHQMSAAASADRIFVMEKGEIVQVGTHKELVGQTGLYQYLWNQQKLEELLH